MLCLLIPSLLQGAPALPASPRPVFERATITAQEGLPSNSITGLCYDQRGDLVVGTSSGLARFDGWTFETYLASQTPGLAGDRISSVATDSLGRTWVGVQGGATSRFDAGQLLPISDGLRFHSMVDVFESTDGLVWLAGSRLACLDGEALIVLGESHGLPEAEGEYACVVEGPEQRLWVASDTGVYRGGLTGFERVDTRPSTWVLRDFVGGIWSLTKDEELVSLSDADRDAFDFEGTTIVDVLDREPFMKLLATNYGLVSVRPGSEDGSGLSFLLLEPFEMTAPERIGLTRLLAGPGADLWAGTERSGLDYIQRRYVEPGRVPKGRRRDPEAMVVAASSGRALVHGSDHGSPYLLNADNALIELDGEPGWTENVFGAATVDEGTWVATAKGMGRLEGARLEPVVRWEKERELVAGCLASNLEGDVWLLSEDGLERVVDGASGSAVAASTADSLRVDAPGLARVFSNAGRVLGIRGHSIVELDETAERLVTLADLGPVEPVYVRGDANGVIWVSTFGSGLYRIGQAGKVDHWSVEAGLPDPFLAWISPPDERGYLWVHSNKGVLKVEIASLDGYLAGTSAAIRARSFPAPDCSTAGGARLSASVFALATQKGPVLFDCEALPPPDRAPQLRFEPTLVNGAETASAVEAVGSTHVHFRFAAPVFPDGSDVQFQYRLTGLDDRWVDGGNRREVRFAALQPGSYALEVRGRTPTSPWSDPIRSARVLIEPHWHERTLVRVLGIGSLLMAIGLIAWARVRTLAKRNAALTAEIDERAQAEAKLRTSERRFRRLFHRAPSPIISWDPSGSLMDWNARAKTMFGPLGDEQGLQRPEEMFADRQLGRGVFERSIGAGEDVSVTAMAAHVSGESRRCRWHLAPTFDRHNQVASLIVLVIDLSRQDRDAQVVAKLREDLVTAEEAERSRIARELHDDLSQRLAVLALNAHLLTAGGGNEESSPSPGALQAEIQEIAGDVHALSRRLHPTIVDDLGLLTALQSECGQRRQQGAIRVPLHIADDVDEPSRELALALFRMGPEAMRNAQRHSQGSRIDVTLEREQEHLVLTVRDDGRGLGPSRGTGGGIGLNSMRERARLAGGDLMIRSEPDAGTSVIARVPVSSSTGSRLLQGRNP
ncbi:MAG: ATP-binding protein [Planctomycetota bacterium]